MRGAVFARRAERQHLQERGLPRGSPHESIPRRSAWHEIDVSLSVISCSAYPTYQRGGDGEMTSDQARHPSARRDSVRNGENYIKKCPLNHNLRNLCVRAPYGPTTGTDLCERCLGRAKSTKFTVKQYTTRGFRESAVLVPLPGQIGSMSDDVVRHRRESR